MSINSAIRSQLIPIVATAASLLLGYAAAYACLVGAYYPFNFQLIPGKETILEYKPVYRIRGRIVEHFFSPIHRLDRHIRPDTWTKRIYFSMEEYQRLLEEDAAWRKTLK
jgi:hypothetical protein